jgi:formyltetrahydrofolate deformylase
VFPHREDPRVRSIEELLRHSDKTDKFSMQVIITAVGPDNQGLADPIVHYVTGVGANIFEIQMYDRDTEHLFAMLLRINWPDDQGGVAVLRDHLHQIGQHRGLQIRVWARSEYQRIPRIAICTTYRTEHPLAILRAIRDRLLPAEAAVMIGNRDACHSVAEQFAVPWHNIGDAAGNPEYDRLETLLDEYDVDYIVLARFMRVLPAELCWKFAGGRIINLHHGLLPSFPGFRPYEDAYQHHMLCYGATVHFIVPELDAGNQIIHQSSFTVLPGTSLKDIKRQGESDHEPHCLVEGLRRVVNQEVELHFHRVVRQGT